MAFRIQVYDQVDPLTVLNLNLLSLNYALTPERARLIRRFDPRPFPFFMLYAVDQGLIVGQVGVYHLPMMIIEGPVDLGGVCAVCTLSPGRVKINLVGQLPWYIRFYLGIRCSPANAQTPEQAANHLINLATQPEVNGKYIEADSGTFLEACSSEESYDGEIAKCLREVSERLVNQHFDY